MIIRLLPIHFGLPIYMYYWYCSLLNVDINLMTIIQIVSGLFMAGTSSCCSPSIHWDIQLLRQTQK